MIPIFITARNSSSHSKSAAIYSNIQNVARKHKFDILTALYALHLKVWVRFLNLIGLNTAR